MKYDREVTVDQAAKLVTEEVHIYKSTTIENAKNAVLEAELLLHTGAKLTRRKDGKFFILGYARDGSDINSLDI